MPSASGREMGRVVEVDFGAGRTRGYLVGFVVGAVADEVRANDGDEGALRGHAADAVVVPVEEVGLTRGSEGEIDGPIQGRGE